MLTDGPHGLRKQAGPADHVGLSDAVPATCFPTASALGSTWDPDLLAEVGRALGREARAHDVAVLLGPGLNLKRHPRGGRAFEYLAEDPYLTGVLAAGLIRGIQSDGVAACPKHFAANNQETQRMVVDTIVDERTLREMYLRGFEIAVAEGQPSTLMTAYNQVNGQYCSDHEVLVRDILRGEWGFDGLVVSDWGGTNDHVAGLRVGMDLEMPGGAAAFDPEIAEALAAGSLDRAALDRSATRIAELVLRWREVVDSGPRPAADLHAHHALARRVAAAGSVLLTNDGLLPLSPTGAIAVVGAFAEQPRFQGGGSSKVNPTRVDSLLTTLTAQTRGHAEVRYAPGYDADSGETTPELMARAAAVAREADVVILVVGLPARWETESLDRGHCRLPAGMDHLAEVVLDANPRTAVVLVNGGVLELPWAHRPAALLEAWLGGQAGGAAIADVLLGLAEPGGRLAESIAERVADLPASANFPGQPRQVEYRERFLVGYRFHDTAGVPAQFPFGHGLGYTQFEFGSIGVVPSGEVPGTTELTVALDVTNTGPRPGSTVVQVYVRACASVVPRPAKELAGFAKVHLEPGGATEVRIPLTRRSFTVWDVATHTWLVEPGEYEILAGASSTDIRGRVVVTIESPDTVTPVPATAGLVATDAEFAALLGGAIPVPRPVLPFTRTTTVAELSASRLGRGLAALMTAGARRRVPTEDLEESAIVAATVAGLPLRAFVQMAGGPLGFAHLDRVLALLNGDLRSVIRPRRTLAP
jgi:beta-glucosidase